MSISPLQSLKEFFGTHVIASFGETLELDGVKFFSDDLGVSVYNTGDDAAYSLENTDMVVAAQSITKITGEDVVHRQRAHHEHQYPAG